MAAWELHRSRGASVARSVHAGRLHHRPQVAADHDGEGPRDTRRLDALAPVRGGHGAGRRTAAHDRGPGRARIRRIDRVAGAVRSLHHPRHDAGVGQRPPAARQNSGRHTMTVTQALGWALVHSLWQCALAAAGLAALLAVLPPRAARARYALAVATLALTLALPIGTLVRLHDASPETTAGSPITAAPAPASRAPAASPEPMPLSPQATHRYGSAAPALAGLRLAPPPLPRPPLPPPRILALWVTRVAAFS